MRKDGIPYVQNPKGYYPPIDYKKLTLDELKAKFLRNCGKSNGDVSVCSRCPTPCQEGKRAIQLLANTIYNDPPVPLYGGKTMIENAKEENFRRREEKEKEQKEEIKLKTSKDNRIYIDNWYEKAMSSEDPVAWIMQNYGISKTKAKQKIYGWRNRHSETKEQSINLSEKKETPVNTITETEKVTEEQMQAMPVQDNKIESILEKLLKRQEDQKKAMDEYYRLYEQAKVEYEKIKQKADVLCNALDIINDD